MIDRSMTIDTVFILKLFFLGKRLRNKKKNIIFLPFYIFVKCTYRLLQIIYGFSMPFSVELGKNVCFKHGLFGIFISSEAVIKNNVIIMHQVTIGSNYTSNKPIMAPYIGDDVFIGPGAKIIGDVKIAAGSKVGANALIVNQDCEQGIYIAPKATKI